MLDGDMNNAHWRLVYDAVQSWISTEKGVRNILGLVVGELNRDGNCYLADDPIEANRKYGKAILEQKAKLVSVMVELERIQEEARFAEGRD